MGPPDSGKLIVLNIFEIGYAFESRYEKHFMKQRRRPDWNTCCKADARRCAR